MNCIVKPTGLEPIEFLKNNILIKAYSGNSCSKALTAKLFMDIDDYIEFNSLGSFVGVGEDYKHFFIHSEPE